MSSTRPGDLGPPWRSDGVTLRREPRPEGPDRLVLEDASGRVRFELARGAEDAFVWARLDGRTGLEQIQSQFSRRFGNPHPALAQLVEAWRGAGLVSEAAETGSCPTELGRRMQELAGRLLHLRLRLPGSTLLGGLVGRIGAPFLGRALAWLAAVLTFSGLMVAFRPATRLDWLGTLLTWEGTPTSLPFALGLAALLAANLLVSLAETAARLAVEVRAGLAVGASGLTLQLGIPGTFTETPEAELLNGQQRLGLAFAPLLVAGGIGGVATLAVAFLTLDPLAKGLVLKLGWAAWLRLLAHLTPFLDTPLRQALRVRRRTVQDRGVPVMRLALTGLYLLTAVPFLAQMARSELLPAWQALRIAPLEVFIVGAGLLLLLIIALGLGVVGWLHATARDALRALAEAELVVSESQLAAHLCALAIALACFPWVGDLLGAHQLAHRGALAIAAIVAVLAAGAGLSGLDREARFGGSRGWTLAWGLLLAGGCWLADLVELGRIDAASLLAAGASLLFYGWVVLETHRPVHPHDEAGRGMVLVGAMLLPPLVALGLGIMGPAVSLGRGLGLLSQALAWVSCAGCALAILRAPDAARTPALVLCSLGLGALAGCWDAWWPSGPPGVAGLPKGGAAFHLPALATALIAGGGWLLARAERAAMDLPSHASALVGDDDPEREVAACAFLIEGLFQSVAGCFGSPTAHALHACLRPHELEMDASDPDDAWLVDRGGVGTAPQRHRAALRTMDAFLRARLGAEFAERLEEEAVTRLPAAAHERLLGEPRPLPQVGAVADVRVGRRVELLRGIVPFSDLNDAQLSELADLVGVRRVPAGRLVVRQGDLGDDFYLLADGLARVQVQQGDTPGRALALLGAGETFGEAALLSHEPRSATVVTKADCLFLVLERDVFADWIQANTELIPLLYQRKEDLRLLRAMPMFARLSGARIGDLCRRVQRVQVEAGEVVLAEGGRSERFYIVREGSVAVRRAVDDTTLQLAILRRGEFFGEVSLLGNRPHVASVVANEPTILLYLESADFQLLVSGIRELGRVMAQRLATLEERLHDPIVSPAAQRRRRPTTYHALEAFSPGKGGSSAQTTTGSTASERLPAMSAPEA